ncbi:MAG: cell division topological specificity factor MinE [Myxococcota bacterium]|nr:cell division topological specificity factor MinE [Myxococcota bacterium]
MKFSIRRLLGMKNMSKDEAKRRLKLLLIHDQLDLSPEQMEFMKAEIMEVVRRYLIVHEDEADFRLDQQEDNVTFVSKLPVSRVKKRKLPSA